MNSTVDHKPFRKWKIPESIITGDFQQLQVNTETPYESKKVGNANNSKRLLSKEIDSNMIATKTSLTNQPKSGRDKTSTVAELLCYANSAERRILLKSFFLSDQQILKFSLRQALMPESEKKIRTWLKIATLEEKTIAIKFFKSLLCNDDLSTDDKYFIQHILVIIKNEDDYWLKPHHKFSDKESKLKFINFHSTDKRNQRWMYTSWNHLPPYNNCNKQ